MTKKQEAELMREATSALFWWRFPANNPDKEVRDDLARRLETAAAELETDAPALEAETVTAAEAASILGVHVETVRRMVRDNKLPAHRLRPVTSAGGRAEMRISRADLHALRA